MTRFIEEKLGLKVNAEKSKVDKPKGIKYLGLGFYYDTSAKGYKARPHPKAVAKFKAQMKKKAYWSDSFSSSLITIQNPLRTPPLPADFGSKMKLLNLPIRIPYRRK